MSNESVNQYNDYFESEKDENDLDILNLNKDSFALAFENWQLPKEDTSSFKTIPFQWNRSLGFWPNTVAFLKEVQKVGEIRGEIDREAALEKLSQTSLVEKNK